jgi:UDP-N-acetylmuramate--alanine ligase
MFEKYRVIHFVGIGGIGMSGIAEVLWNLGYDVTGSDMKESETTVRLRNMGMKVHIGHKEENIDSAHVVVVSSAVSQDNPEIVAAGRLSVPVIPRAEMLAELARLKYGILVAGSHGKTTTTSLVSTALARGGFDPTLIIGGRLKAIGKRRLLSQAVAHHSRGHKHRQGAYGVFQGHEEPERGLLVLCQQGAFLRGLLRLQRRRKHQRYIAGYT